MSEAFWALGRASGVVLLVLMTLSMLLGLLTRSGRPLLRLPRFGVQLAHRNIALLSVVFLVVHIGSLLLDPYAQLRLVDVIVPFAAAKDPLAVGLGTAALDLLVAVVVTALLRRRIGVRAFRVVHWATYLLWPISLLHGITAGSDGRSSAFLVLAAVSALAVGAAAVWRTTDGFVEYRRSRTEPVR
ncbi:ferric reductase-like transmembrane domain-containing protein [Amnibacterium kyonggiense]|uniref:Ferric reductase like protein n=1 Tax=Amnibacterium kyonggiense TaxID=595671 RepID=A0A4R7FP25_9MICO|nr:ferric reductase-like transmembrane domain-containing protein [Amnibacterium kyonggiense]TDS79485.1 ferric reductase like protein [Amnibacterium kyonggiense]